MSGFLLKPLRRPARPEGGSGGRSGGARTQRDYTDLTKTFYQQNVKKTRYIGIFFTSHSPYTKPT